MKNYITNEDVLTLNEINGWKPVDEQFSGCIHWYHPEKDSLIYATPNWERDGEVPIATFNEETDNYENLMNVNLQYGSTIEEQLEYYKHTIEGITKHIKLN